MRGGEERWRKKEKRKPDRDNETEGARKEKGRDTKSKKMEKGMEEDLDNEM